MIWWHWCVFGLILLILEVLTPGAMFVLFFGLSAISVGLLVYFVDSIAPWIQWFLFSIFSVLGLLFFRKKLLIQFDIKVSKDNVDSFINQQVVTNETIEVNQEGKVEFRGSQWTAKNIGKSVLVKGQQALIESADGLKLNIKNKES